MLVFIDECGDHGVKFDKHSSPYFTVAMVIFRDDEEAEKCNQKIDELKRELHLPNGFEFHFTKNLRKVKARFVEIITTFDFSYYIFIIDKRMCYELWYHTKRSFYEYVAKLIREHTQNTLINARIIIDKQGGEEFEQHFTTYFKRGMNGSGSKRVKKLVAQNSRKYNLLQLADYIAGIVHRHYDPNKFIKIDYFSMIQHKCIKIVVRPEK